MERLIRRWLPLAALVLALTPRPAAADPRPDGEKGQSGKGTKSKAEKKADRLLAEGKRLGEDGEPEKALAKFREAERAFSRPVHLCNIGIAYETMGNLPLSLLYLERCREKAQSFPRWLAAKHGEVAAELARTHAPVEFRVSPRKAKVRVSAFGDDEPLQSGERVFLPRGEWTVVARRKGYVEREASVQVRNLAGQRLDLTLDREPGAAGDEEEEVGGGGGGGARVAGGVLMGLGLVGIGTGAFFHYRSVNARDEARTLPPGPAFDEKRADYRRDGWIAVGAYATGAVCVGVGTYLLLRRGDASEEDARVAVSVGASGDFMVSLSFAR